MLSESPTPLRRLWCEHVNRPPSEAELEAIRRSLAKGQPFGGETWQAKVTRQLGLAHTFRPRGRPKKEAESDSKSGASQN